MKTQFFLFCFLFLSFFSTAQVLKDTATIRKEVNDLVTSNRNLTGQSNYDAALKNIELAERKAADGFGKNSALYAQCLFNHGRTYFFMKEYDKGAPLYLDALSIQEKVLGKEHLDCLKSMHNLAFLYLNNGEYDKAEPLIMKALAIREKLVGKKHADYAVSLELLANLHWYRGEYDKAEPLYIEIKTIREERLGKAHPYYAITLNNLANIYLIKGDYDKAEQLYLEFKAIAEKGAENEPRYYVASLNNLANVYLLKTQFAKAETLYLEAKAIYEKIVGKEDPDYALSLINLATLYEDNGSYDKAQPLFLEAEPILEKALGKEHPYYATYLLGLAILYNDMGEYDLAKPLHLEAKALLAKVFGKEHARYAESLNFLALLYRDTGQLEKSEECFTEASSITKRILRKAATYLSSQELEKYIDFYRVKNEAFLCFNRQTTSDAFRIESYNNVLFYKGFCLETAARLEQIMRNASDSLRAIYSHWKGSNRLLAAELVKPIEDRKQVFYLDSMSNALEKVLRATPDFDKALKPVEWQDVHKALPDGSAAIEFIEYGYSKSGKRNTDSTMYSALVIMPEGKAPIFIPLCEAKQLDALVYNPGGTLVNYLQKLYASPRKDGLPSLYQLLWKPIEKLLREQNIKTVYYAPTGLLHRINLGAITEGKSGISLGERYHLIQMGSTRQLVTDQSPEVPVQLNDALIYGGVRYEMDSSTISSANARIGALPRDTTGGLFGFAHQTKGQSGENWDFLPGTEQGATYLDSLLQARSINTTLRLGYEATEESFKQIGENGPSPSLLHIGTHGFFFSDPKDTTHRQPSSNAGDPAFKISEFSMIRSGLKLAGSRYAWENGHPLPGGHEDGILTAYEVSQMNLSNTQLVVLSACETGLGDIHNNEGVYGLQRAFRIAGAKNVLMSLWSVPDDATQQLMSRFYSNWLNEKKPLRASFEEAQQWLRRQDGFENPYFWAAFVLVE